MIKFRGIDIEAHIIDSEFRIAVLERLLEKILSSNEKLIVPDQEQLEEIRKEIIEMLRDKYPTCEIKYKPIHF